MSVPEFDDTGETRLLMMVIAHVVVTERTGQNMLESVLYSIINLDLRSKLRNKP